MCELSMTLCIPAAGRDAGFVRTIWERRSLLAFKPATGLSCLSCLATGIFGFAQCFVNLALDVLVERGFRWYFRGRFRRRIARFRLFCRRLYVSCRLICP